MSLAAGHESLAQVSKHLPAAGSGVDLTRLVNVMCGTGGHGHVFPGATLPFGAVQVSPDTGNHGWDWCSGYYTSDTSIMGFSHTHLSGTGGGDLLDILLVPGVGEVKLVPGTNEDPDSGFRTRFSHAEEHAEPGFYSVRLANALQVDLTATERTGLHRYRFPAGSDAHVLVDLHHAYGSDTDLSKQQPVKSAQLRLSGNDTVTGGRLMHGWSPTRQVYFALQFSRPFSKSQVYDARQPVSGSEANGSVLQAVLHFDTANPELLAKVGISMVSAENALANLKAEQPGWDFEKTRGNARRAWQRELEKIAIDSDDVQRKTIFYTSMYHMMCAPTLADDANGQYRGMDQKVHTLAKGEHNYSTYSLWDTYRALHPSFTLWQGERVAPMVNNLVRMAEESPEGIPVWPLAGGETGCMTGYHSASVMAEACVKKVPGIDWQRTYAVMRKRNMEDNYRGLGFYRQIGYIPADREEESVSKLLEYNYGDWACAHVAEATGHTEDATTQRERSQNYKHLFDSKTQFIRAKMQDGSWTPDFNPKATGHSKKYRDYTESNAWQTTFGVQHDVKGYIGMFGGREPFLKKLDALFVEEPGVSNEEVVDMSGYIGQYVHGNEPSHHIAYLYTYAGQPWKTQQRVRQILDTLYRNDLDGLAGNEDCGQMSAWYVMSALGLYAVDPVSATYVLTAPTFDRARLRVGGGRELVIEARRSAQNDIYVQTVQLNGKPYNKLWITHAEIANGAHLVFQLGPEPNTELGSDERLAPPSLTA